MQFPISNQSSILKNFKKILSILVPIRIFDIVGASMTPTLFPKQKILVWLFGNLRTGNIVVLKDPRNGRLLVKRIMQIDKEKLFVEGDNKKESTDSRHFGWVSKEFLVGKVIYPQR